MKSTIIAALAGLLLAASASAQEPAARPRQLNGRISLGELTPTSEMWFYEQEMRQHADPGLAVRRKAELKAAQRQLRIATRKWYGISASRPTTSPEPMYSHSPYWSNGYGAWGWIGPRWATRVVEPDEGYRHSLR